ncbi:hypothetical protein Ahy_B03g067510 [Arachis hypogaea]|uniref:Uncharacterized protein n=1 Tax=Arachis hypogaea TaxID=3818 RepID=A0A445A7B3_ARAHY|nr:hypothetical protein Ahy_B03g067510 [Arachis hypogaea]
MLKQHSELSMFVHRTIENNEEARIRPSKTYQSFVVAVGGHRELNFIEKDVKNYITRKVWNVFEQDDAKEFGFVAWEKRHQKGFLPINVHRCKGLLRLVCQQQFTGSVFGIS